MNSTVNFIKSPHEEARFLPMNWPIEFGSNLSMTELNNLNINNSVRLEKEYILDISNLFFLKNHPLQKYFNILNKSIKLRTGNIYENGIVNIDHASIKILDISHEIDIYKNHIVGGHTHCLPFLMLSEPFSFGIHRLEPELKEDPKYKGMRYYLYIENSLNIKNENNLYAFYEKGDYEIKMCKKYKLDDTYTLSVVQVFTASDFFENLEQMVAKSLTYDNFMIKVASFGHRINITFYDRKELTDVLLVRHVLSKIDPEEHDFFKTFLLNFIEILIKSNKEVNILHIIKEYSLMNKKVDMQSFNNLDSLYA